MIKIERVQVTGFEHAIRGMSAKGYRKTKTGYETFVSVKQRKIGLGTYKTEQEAIQIIHKHRIKRFLDGIGNLNPNDCVGFCKNYVAFKSGEIFNLHGVEIRGMIDKCGYREVSINGTMERIHRIIALCFLENNENKKCVNHIDGNKLNNNVSNLEWCTHSENTLHSFRNGIQKTISNKYCNKTPLTEQQKMQISEDYNSYTKKELALKYNVCERTVRKYKEYTL